MTAIPTRRRECANCGATFSARSSRAQFCGDRCRSKARYRRVTSPPAADLYGLPIPSPSSDLADTVATELTRMGRLSTVAGVAALTVARRIDAGAESSAGLASLVRELRNCMADALADVEHDAEPSALDLITARRRERQAQMGAAT